MHLQSPVVLFYNSIYCVDNKEKWEMAYPLKFLFEGNTSWYVTPGLKIILAVAWKLISEWKNAGWIFQEENVVRVGGEIFLMHIITHVKL